MSEYGLPVTRETESKIHLRCIRETFPETTIKKASETER